MPVEKCLFVLLVPMMVGTGLRKLRGQAARRRPLPHPDRRSDGLAPVAAAGAAFAAEPATSYLELTWAAPPVSLQWAVGGDVLWARRELLG